MQWRRSRTSTRPERPEDNPLRRLRRPGRSRPADLLAGTPELTRRGLHPQDHAAASRSILARIRRATGRAGRAARRAALGRSHPAFRHVAGEPFVAERDRQPRGLRDRDRPGPSGGCGPALAPGHVEGQADTSSPTPLDSTTVTSAATSAASERPRPRVVSGRALSASGSASARPIRRVPRSTPRSRLMAPPTPTAPASARRPLGPPREGRHGRQGSGSCSPNRATG